MKTIREKIIVGGIFLSLVLPFVFTSRTMFPSHFGKLMLFFILIDLLLIVAAVDFIKTKKEVFRWNSIDSALLIFSGVLILATVSSVDPSRSFWSGQSRTQGLFTWLHFTSLYVMLRQYIQTNQLWNKVLKVGVSAAVISAVIAWVGPYLPFFQDVIERGALRGLIGNTIFFASYLMIPIGIAATMLVEESSAEKRRYLGALAVFLVVSLVGSGSRGAFIGLAAGLTAFTVGYIWLGTQKKVKYVISAAFAALAVLWVGLFATYRLNPVILEQNAPILARLASISPSATTASTRLMAWEIAFKGWQDKKLLGWGPENYEEVFNTYYNPAFLRFGFSETQWDKPHNYALEVLVGAGVAGFAVYAALVGLLVGCLATMAKRAASEKQKTAFIILASTAVAYVVQNLFAFETTNSLHWWIIFAAFISYHWSSYRGDFTKEASGIVLPSYVVVVAALVLIPAACLSTLTSARFYRASIAMGDARDRVEVGLSNSWSKHAQVVLATEVPFMWEQGIFLVQDMIALDQNGSLTKEAVQATAPEIEEIFKEKIADNDQTYKFRFWLSQLYSIMGEYLDTAYLVQANDLLVEAAEMNPDRQHTSLLMAKNYLLQNKVDDAINILRTLREKDLSFPEVRWLLGVALTGNGQIAEGITELEAGYAFGRAFPDSIRYVIDLYVDQKEYKKIVPLYKDLIVFEPTNAQNHASLAAVYAELEDTEQMISHLVKAVELEPSLMDEAREFLKQHNVDITLF